MQQINRRKKNNKHILISIWRNERTTQILYFLVKEQYIYDK